MTARRGWQRFVVVDCVGCGMMRGGMGVMVLLFKSLRFDSVGRAWRDARRAAQLGRPGGFVVVIVVGVAVGTVVAAAPLDGHVVRRRRQLMRVLPSVYAHADGGPEAHAPRVDRPVRRDAAGGCWCGGGREWRANGAAGAGRRGHGDTVSAGGRTPDGSRGASTFLLVCWKIGRMSDSVVVGVAGPGRDDGVSEWVTGAGAAGVVVVVVDGFDVVGVVSAASTSSPTF